MYFYHDTHFWEFFSKNNPKINWSSFTIVVWHVSGCNFVYSGIWNIDISDITFRPSFANSIDAIETSINSFSVRNCNFGTLTFNLTDVGNVDIINCTFNWVNFPWIFVLNREIMTVVELHTLRIVDTEPHDNRFLFSCGTFLIIFHHLFCVRIFWEFSDRCRCTYYLYPPIAFSTRWILPSGIFAEISSSVQTPWVRAIPSPVYNSTIRNCTPRTTRFITVMERL